MSETGYVRLWTATAERRERLCRAFYDGVYRDCFPESDETEDPDIWLPLMRPDPPYGKPRVFMICACRGDADTPDERVLGGIVFELYRRTGDWLATYIAVRDAERRSGLGRALFSEMVKSIGELAPSPGWQLYAEAENPPAETGARRAAMYHRLAVLSTLGLRRLPFDYVQPSLGPSKRQLTTLLFLCWPRGIEGGDAPLQPGRLISFLGEFYAAHGQSDAAVLESMTEQLKAMHRIKPQLLEVPARYDHTLGAAGTIVIRMTFFIHNVHKTAARADEATETESIPLDWVHKAGRKSTATGHDLHSLSDTLGSFYNDIVVPFASATSLPIILQCEPFREDPKPGTDERPPPTVSIVFPEKIDIEWEGIKRPIPFSSPDERRWVVAARLVDTIAIYESGYVAYSVALIFGRSGGRRPMVNAAAILALTALAEPAGRVAGGQIGFAFGDEPPTPAHEFLHNRLQALSDAAADDGITAFSVLHAIEDPATGAAIRDGLLRMTFPDPTQDADAATAKASISVEVIGADRHDRILAAAAQATERHATASPFTLRLAGIAQNVLDFHEQDDSEINDSLAGGVKVGDDITFAQKNMAIRFSRESRSFEKMWAVAGGEPYWMLVELIVGHNGKLLSDLNDDIREHQGQRGLSTLLRQMLFLDNDLSSEEQRKAASRDLQRIQNRRIRLTHYIPNIFRYPIEKSLYDTFIDARGLRIQRQYFTDLELTMERMFREVAQLKTAVAEARERDSEKRRQEADQRRQEADELRKQDDGKRNELLVVIGVAQAAGVFAGFASVFAAIASIDDEKYLRPFVAEIEDEIGMSTIERFIHALPRDLGMPAMSHDAWALIPALGLVCAGISFVGAMTVIFVQRYFKRPRNALAIVAAPLALAVLVWVLADITRKPFLDIIIPLCIVAVLLPIGMYRLWRSRA